MQTITFNVKCAMLEHIRAKICTWNFFTTNLSALQNSTLNTEQ